MYENTNTNHEETIANQICPLCGCVIESDPVYLEGCDTPVCRDCFDRGVAFCDDCGEPCYEDDLTTVSNGDRVCESCLDEGYEYCEDCGEWVDERYTVTVNPGRRDERIVCESCADSSRYVRCSDCGELVSIRHIDLSDGNVDICDCCSSDWGSCNNCGAVMRTEDMCYDDEEWEYYCPDCWSSRNARGLHDYSYKPSPIFGTCDDLDGRDYYAGSDLTFGVELEVEDGDNRSSAISSVYDEAGDRVYVKHDGSLNDDGFEIVTHPGTLAWHETRFPWDSLCRGVLSYGYRSHDARNCGLHIHVGLPQMVAPEHDKTVIRGRLGVLVQRLWPEICRLARRGSGTYNHKPDVMRLLSSYTREVLESNEHDACEKVRQELRRTRYNAVNVCNSNTVEFRFCKGTLKPSTILASLQLVSNLCRYAMTHSLVQCAEAEWAEVLAVESHEELNAYAAMRFAGWSVSDGERDSAKYREARPEPTGDAAPEGIRVGDTVRLLPPFARAGRGIGVVVEVYDDDSPLVLIAGADGETGIGHDGGRPDGTYNGNALWVPGSSLEVINRPGSRAGVQVAVEAAKANLFLGDQVRQRSPEGGEGVLELVGCTGVIVGFNSYHNLWVAVDFGAAFVGCHICGGLLPEPTGRYFPVSNLVRA